MSVIGLSSLRAQESSEMCCMTALLKTTFPMSSASYGGENDRCTLDNDNSCQLAGPLMGIGRRTERWPALYLPFAEVRFA